MLVVGVTLAILPVLRRMKHDWTCLAVTATIAVGYAVAQANEAYDANGRLVVRSIQHGTSASSYSPDGRLLRYVGSGSR
jgi:hypothetical protein